MSNNRAKTVKMQGHGAIIMYIKSFHEGGKGMEN